MLKVVAFRGSLLTGLVILFAGAFIFPTIGLADLTDGLVAYWNFDEGSGSVLHDIVGGYNGTIYGATWTTNGACGKALQFDGSNDYVSVPDNNAWAFGSNDFTIVLWDNFDQPGHGTIYQPGDIFIANNEGSGYHNKWLFALGGGVLFFHINAPSIPHTLYFPQVPFSPVVGQWYQLAVTRSGNTYTIFVNGDVGGSAVETHAVPDANAPLTIGAGEAWGGYMGGRLDEVRIYNRALSNTEIKELYDMCAPPIPTLSEWGLIIFGVVLLGFITWVFLRRRKVIAVGV